MTVAELIRELEKKPPEKTVYFAASDREQRRIWAVTSDEDGAVVLR